MIPFLHHPDVQAVDISFYFSQAFPITFVNETPKTQAPQEGQDGPVPWSGSTTRMNWTPKGKLSCANRTACYSLHLLQVKTANSLFCY